MTNQPTSALLERIVEGVLSQITQVKSEKSAGVKDGAIYSTQIVIMHEDADGERYEHPIKFMGTVLPDSKGHKVRYILKADGIIFPPTGYIQKLIDLELDKTYSAKI